MELLYDRPAHRADDHEAAIFGKTVEIALEIRRADHIEYHVDAASFGALRDQRLERLLAIVDGQLGA